MSKRRDKSKRSEGGDSAPAPVGPPSRKLPRVIVSLFALWLLVMIGVAGFFPRIAPIQASLVRNTSVIVVGVRVESGIKVAKWLKGSATARDPSIPLRLALTPVGLDDAGERLWFLRPVFPDLSNPDAVDDPQYELVDAPERALPPADKSVVAQIEQVLADDAKRAAKR